MIHSLAVRVLAAWSNRPLHQKLSLSVWLAVVPITLVTSLVAMQHARDMVVARLRQQLVWDAEQANAYLNYWELHHLHSLRLLSINDDVQSLTPSALRPMVRQMVHLFPDYGYAIAGIDGALLAQDGAVRLPAIPSIMSGLMRDPTSAFARAARGIGSSSILMPPIVSSPCVASAVPVYERGSVLPSPVKTSVVGIASACLPLEKIGYVTGIDDLMRSASNSRGAVPMIDFDKSKPYGYALLVVFNRNSFVSLGDRDNSKLVEKRYSIQGRESPDWTPIVNLAFSSQAPKSFNRIRIKNIKYYVGVDRQTPGRTAIMVVDQRSAFAVIHSFITSIWIGNFVALSVSSVAVYRISRGLAKPIDQAGESLSRISRGEFGPPLPTDKSDVGRLFAYVNNASEQLQSYLRDSKEHAVIDAQLQEARRIQSDFLIQQLPSSSQVDLSALFQPAYQIGADWYDSIAVDGITFLVVADVCDKGIPSALYMSVFRSLLRSSLQKVWDQFGDPAETLLRSITTVNEYMAETHGSTGMFATVFIAAIDPSSDRLIHVVAGHEAPLVQCGDAIESLPLGGPAVGLFTDAAYVVSSCVFAEGALMLAFSDGLPDARDPEGSRFGMQRVMSVVSEHNSGDWGAEELVTRLHGAVSDYMNGAEPFDDLTLFVAKRPSPIV